MKLGNSNLVTISFAVCIALSLTVPTEPQISDNEFPIPVDSEDQDFIVKFKGEIFSWKNLSQLLRQHNITVPHESDVLTAVLGQKKTRAQSCEGRCFLDERKYSDKTCFCDVACKIFSDCCLDFYSRCNQTGNNVSVENVACGDVNERSWFGIIMKSSCSAHGHQRGTNDCETAQRLDMTLQKELPVFDLAHKITYRSIACARCNNEGGNFSFWGLDISCERSNGSIATPVNITAVKRFLKEHTDCSWKYAPMPKWKQQHNSCVLHDTRCVSNHLPVMSVVKELCYSYSMVFSVFFRGKPLTSRNPHCALCNPEIKPARTETDLIKMLQAQPLCFCSRLSILLDVSSNILDQKEQPSFIPALATQNQKDGSTILVYITFVGTSLSITSLSFLLGLYLFFKELRNLPGKCLINLSLALLCYQSIFLGAVKETKVDLLCKVVAIFLHFFVLAAFSWMSVMAFDTGNTFKVKVRIACRHPSDTKKAFIKYCIVGWGLPVVVVVLCCILDFTETFHVGYGNWSFCWISDKTAIAVTMVTPASFAMIFNTVCLVKNARVIRRLRQGASLTTNNSSRPSPTLICIKLTTVMGLTWILGLTGIWKQTAFLQYPFTVLTSLQGFFIALCFITTKKVRSLLKERFCNRWNGAVEPRANVYRDQFAGNTRAQTVPGSNMFEMKCLSMEQAGQNSS